MKVILLIVFFFSIYNDVNAAVLPLNLKQHADSTPVKLKKNHLELTKYLIKSTKSDEEKVLIISYWISKNIIYDKHEIIRLGKNKTGQELLQNRKGVCGCMANLFQQMCDNASVKCETIQGKAYGNFIKRYFTYFHLRHAWNSVYINNEWKLVDVTWDCYRAKTSAFKKDRELEWVFKNSNEFAKTHFPYNPAWQLLNDPYTKKEFWRQLEPSKKEYMFNDTLKNFIDSSSVLASLSSIKSTYFYDNNKGKYITDLHKLGWNTIFNASDSIQVEDGLKVYETLSKAINTEGFEKYKKKYESTVSFIDEHKYVGLLSRK